MGSYIVGYTFGNHVLRLYSRVAVQLNFRPYIRRYASLYEKFEYSYPLIDDVTELMFTVNDVRCTQRLNSTLNNEQMHQNGLTRTTLLATESKFVEKNMFLF